MTECHSSVLFIREKNMVRLLTSSYDRHPTIYSMKHNDATTNKKEIRWETYGD
jgi:hypothetical protein